MKPRRSLLRDRDKGASVTDIELFFDLVFAVTQLSHTPLADLTALKALHVLPGASRKPTIPASTRGCSTPS